MRWIDCKIGQWSPKGPTSWWGSLTLWSGKRNASKPICLPHTRCGSVDIVTNRLCMLSMEFSPKDAEDWTVHYSCAGSSKKLVMYVNPTIITEKGNRTRRSWLCTDPRHKSSHLSQQVVACRNCMTADSSSLGALSEPVWGKRQSNNVNQQEGFLCRLRSILRAEWWWDWQGIPMLESHRLSMPCSARRKPRSHQPRARPNIFKP